MIHSSTTNGGSVHGTTLVKPSADGNNNGSPITLPPIRWIYRNGKKKEPHVPKFRIDPERGYVQVDSDSSDSISSLYLGDDESDDDSASPGDETKCPHNCGYVATSSNILGHNCVEYLKSLLVSAKVELRESRRHHEQITKEGRLTEVQREKFVKGALGFIDAGYTPFVRFSYFKNKHTDKIINIIKDEIQKENAGDWYKLARGIRKTLATTFKGDWMVWITIKNKVDVATSFPPSNFMNVFFGKLSVIVWKIHLADGKSQKSGI